MRGTCGGGGGVHNLRRSSLSGGASGGSAAPESEHFLKFSTPGASVPSPWSRLSLGCRRNPQCSAERLT